MDNPIKITYTPSTRTEVSEVVEELKNKGFYVSDYCVNEMFYELKKGTRVKGKWDDPIKMFTPIKSEYTILCQTNGTRYVK